MNPDPEKSAEIVHLLKETGIKTQSVATLSELKQRLKEDSFIAVILDIDSMTVDNRSIKDIALQFPNVPFLGISMERFHPELKDSIRDHLYACLTQPIDPGELNYWIKCIQEDRSPNQ